MKDLEREVELLREKVQLLERLRELEGTPYTPPYVPYYPTPGTGDAPPWTTPWIITCESRTDGPCSFTYTQ